MGEFKNGHLRGLCALCGCLFASLAAGCGGNLPRLSDRAVIAVWRSMPGRGLRTGARVIAADLRQERDVFTRFYANAREVGLCDGVELERALDARGLIIVQFSQPGGSVRELHVLQDKSGQPLTVGHGPVDVFAREPNCPRYRYRQADVEALNDWFKRQPPEADAGAPPPPESPRRGERPTGPPRQEGQR